MSHRVPRWFSIFLLIVLVLSSHLSAGAAPGARQAGPPSPAAQPDGIFISLANAEFDPLAPGGLESAAGAQLEAAVAESPDGYYLVQFDGPVTEAQVAALEGAGGAVFDYIPDFTFIVHMDPSVRSAVEAQAGVRWVGSYLPAFRVDHELLASSAAASASAAATAAAPDAENGKQAIPVTAGAAEVVVDVFPGQSLAPIIDAVQGFGGEVSDRSESEWRSKLRLTLPADRVNDLAGLPGVRWIEAAPDWKLFNNISTGIMGGRTAWNAHGLRGAGQVVGVADTGLDQGSSNPGLLHDDFENGSGASRVIAVYDRVGDGASDVRSGHGTHVTGSVLGNGARSGSNPAAHSYPATSYAGLAPEAKLVFQAVENNNDGRLTGIPGDLNQLFAEAASSGATIHTNSWGSADASAYTLDAASVDEYAWSHKDFTILFSAGNEGIDNDADGVVDHYSVGSPATAKNAIAVGASENNRPSGSTPAPGYNGTWGTGWSRFFPANPVRDDHVSNNPDGIAAFSSRGPALDGRIKPDVVAPGTNIISTRSSLATSNGWGAVNADYVYMGGTSMATPLTAGATALIRQFYTDQKHVIPSAALLKATLANGATNIAPGQYGGGTTQEIGGVRPTNTAGWGRVNLDSLFPSSGGALYFEDQRTGLSTGNTKEFTYNVTDTRQQLRVTLAWTDYPGSAVAGGGLVNDLDLAVVGPDGKTYYPNNANPRAPAQHLAYDSGTPTGYYTWSAGKRVAVRFTPASYPSDLQLARFFVGANDTTSRPLTFKFNWYVYNGSASGPGALLASGSTTTRDFGWHTLDLASRNIRIANGDFFIALELPDSNMTWGFEKSSPISGRSWDIDGSVWRLNTQADYMINAVMARPLDGTLQDRVNNLQGIDIASPAVGAYRVVVRGYNVPRGPQPYALVVSLAPVKKIFLPVVLNGSRAVLPTRFDAAADATIQSSSPVTNFGTDSNMLTGYFDCPDYPELTGVWRAFLKFDLAAIPGNTPITSARLSLYQVGSCDYPDRIRAATAYRVGSAWTETGTTWNNQPSIQEASGSVNLPSSVPGRYSIDVTGLVRGWINGSVPNYGVAVRSPEASGSDSAALGFGTRETSAQWGQTYVPYLEITYAGAAAAAASDEQATPPPTCGNEALSGGKAWRWVCDLK